MNTKLLLAVSLMALMTAAAGATDRPGISSFPVIRETITYSGMDWETYQRIPQTKEVVDNDPFVIVTAGRVTPPAGGVPASRIPEYRVEVGLANIANRGDFGAFNTDQRRRLEANAFVVVPPASPRLQMFNLYEENVYRNLPSFITADLFLHTYSDLFSYTMRKVERRKLFGMVTLLSESLRRESRRQATAATDPGVKGAAERNTAFFGVAEELLRNRNIEDPALGAEITRIRNAAGTERSPLLGGLEIDYTQFKPRGYYTASENWQNYFRAMMWFGQASFEVPADTRPTPELLQAELMVLALDAARAEGKPAWETWDRVDSLITLFTGPSNYLTLRQLQTAMKAVWGRNLTAAALRDAAKQAQLIAKLNALDPSLIQHQGAPPRQVRFFGKRYVLDTYLMQFLVQGPERPFANGLDVLAPLGFDHARYLQERVYKIPERVGWYSSRMDTLVAMVGAVPERTWTGSAYWGTLWTLAALDTDGMDTAPLFMRSDAWRDKTLTTALGSWAELRHNTILYAEAFSAEGDGNRFVVEYPKGYIEPNARFWNRLDWLSRKLRADLAAAGCLTQKMDARFKLFSELTGRCVKLVEQELKAQALTRADYEFIHGIGSQAGQITTGCLLNDAYQSDYTLEVQWGNLPEGSRDQAVIADVGTAGSQCLEVASGRPQEIYVIVPSSRGRAPRLARGAVYQYHEFLQPAANRLTDEQWREMLGSDHPQQVPAWSDSYRNKQPKPVPPGNTNFGDLDRYDYRFEAD